MCAQGPGQALLPGPSTGTHMPHFPHPALSPPAVGHEPTQPSGGSEGESSGPGPSLPEHPWVLTERSEQWEQRRGRGRGGLRCCQVGPRALPFRWGWSHKGPFVLSLPWPALHCPPPLRRAQWDIVQSRKGPLVQPPAPGALGSLLGSAQGGRGHQRGLLGAHVLMSPPGSSFLS